MAGDQQQFAQSVPLKYALASVAVHQKKHLIKQSELVSKIDSLQTELQTATQQLKEAQEKLTPSVLQLFNTASSVNDGAASKSTNNTLQSQLQNSILWAHTIHTLPPDLQSCVFRCQYYVAVKNINKAASILDSTPMQTITETINDLLDAINVEKSPSCSLEKPNDTKEEEATNANVVQNLQQAALCLATIVNNPAECMGEPDGAALEEHVSMLLELACVVPVTEPSSLPQRERNDPATAGHSQAPSTNIPQQTAQQLLSALTASPGCGLLILSSAAYLYQAGLTRLVQDITGENEQDNDAFDIATTAGGFSVQMPTSATADITQQASLPLDQHIEQSLPLPQVFKQATQPQLLQILNELAPFLHRCLRALPSWTAAATPSEEFLKDTAERIWKANDVCPVISLTHGDVVRHVQRSVALMVSALQQMKDGALGDDEGNEISQV